MMTVQSSDKFLVNKNGVSYHVTQANLMAEIQDTDLMLVNRSGVSYKITGAEAKGSFVSPIVVQSVTLSDTTPVVGEPLAAIVLYTGGKSPVITYQWKRNASDISGATDAVYIPVTADIGSPLSCVATVSDDLGDSASLESAQSANVLSNEIVNTPTLLTPPNGAGIVDPATALDPEEVNMTCTAFSGIGDPVYASTTWQIAFDADTAFDNPVVNETNVSETFYTASGLAEDTTYRARVKQTSSNGTASDFSPANVFKTKAPLADNLIGANNYVGDGTDTNADIPLIVGGGSNFSVGNTVQQTSTYTPTSSTITNVATVSDVTYRYVVAQAADCTTLTWAEGVGENTVPIGNAPASGSDVYQTMWLLDASSQSTYYNSGPSVQISLYSSYDGTNWTFDVQGPSDSSQGLTSIGAAPYWMAIRGADRTSSDPNTGLAVMSRAGYYVVANSAKTLTLTNNFDLKYFQNGDVVQSPWNQSQVWSNGLQAGSSPQSPYPITAAFNGDVTTAYNCCFPDPGNFVGVDFTGLESASEIVVYYTMAGSGAFLQINGIPVTLPAASPGPAQVTVDVSGTGLTKAYWNEIDSSNFVGIYGLEVDGKLLVDTGVPNAANITVVSTNQVANKIVVSGGSWKGSDGTGDQGDDRYVPSQEWSTSLTSSTGFLYPATNGFDGSVGTGSDSATAAPINYVGLLTFTQSGFTPNQPVLVYAFTNNSAQGGNQPSNDVYVEINGTKTINTGQSGSIVVPGTIDSNGDLVVKLNSVTNGGSVGWNYSFLQGISVNGKLLVDNSAPGGPGDTQVITSAKRGSGTVSSVSGNDVVVSPWTDNAFVIGKYIEVAGALFFDANTNTLISAAEIRRTYGLQPADAIRGRIFSLPSTT